MQFLKKK